ncbi:MAG: hypothetical protein M1813_002764 [Trichoglossum hirsutum]|nr:MAG: hypothetical protein M1813_002764 [Trichoglossum hirsutum]
MDSSPKEKGKEFSSREAETDGISTNSCVSSGAAQTDSPSMASRLAASASGLTRGVLGIDAAPESISSALASSGSTGKSQTLPPADNNESLTWAEGSGASRAANIGSTRYRPFFRRETQQEQASELEFASFLESQPVQTFESSPTITKSDQPSDIGLTTTHGQPISEPAQQARDMLIANGVNPNLLTAVQLQSFQQQDTSEQRQSILSYIRSGNATWEPEDAGESNTGTDYHQHNLQATTKGKGPQSELELSQRARNMLIINDINPDLLTESQLLSFQQEDLDKQKLLIRTYFEDLNNGIRSNGWVRQAANGAHPDHVRQGQPEDSQGQNPHPHASSLQLYNQQDGLIQPNRVQVNTDRLKAASVDFAKPNVMVGQMNPPAQNTSRAQQAIELLVANGINPEQLTASQFNSFQQQNLNVQQKSVEVYLKNLAQHERSIRQQEERRQQHISQHEEDGAAVVALLSQPNFLDLIDTSQDDDDLPPIWSLELTSSQIDTIERLKALLPAPPTHNPSFPTQALNLIPTEALSIPSLWDHGDANASHAEQTNSRQQWLQDWDGVLRQYADEVWGDLLPLVEEAREEIEEAKENDGEVQGEVRAVTRLAMILGHLRDNKIAQNG